MLSVGLRFFRIKNQYNHESTKGRKPEIFFFFVFSRFPVFVMGLTSDRASEWKQEARSP
jgi:hypothetical protein